MKNINLYFSNCTKDFGHLTSGFQSRTMFSLCFLLFFFCSFLDHQPQSRQNTFSEALRTQRYQSNTHAPQLRGMLTWIGTFTWLTLLRQRYWMVPWKFSSMECKIKAVPEKTVCWLLYFINCYSFFKHKEYTHTTHTHTHTHTANMHPLSHRRKKHAHTLTHTQKTCTHSHTHAKNMLTLTHPQQTCTHTHTPATNMHILTHIQQTCTHTHTHAINMHTHSHTCNK